MNLITLILFVMVMGMACNESHLIEFEKILFGEVEE